MNRKRIKRICAAAAALLCIALLSACLCGCSKGEELQITLNQTELVLDFFEEGVLTAEVTGGDAEVVWSSSDPSVAEVDNGKVSARGEGSALIIASAGKAKAECSVQVRDSGEIPSVRLSEISLELETGRSVSVTAQAVYKKNVLQAEFSFASNDETVASVTQEGRITAVGAGKTQVVASAVINGVTVYGEVFVTVPR